MLQLADLSRQGWLGDAQAARGAPDVAFFGHRNEIAQLIEAHPSKPTTAAEAVRLARARQAYPNGIGQAWPVGFMIPG